MNMLPGVRVRYLTNFFLSREMFIFRVAPIESVDIGASGSRPASSSLWGGRQHTYELYLLTNMELYSVPSVKLTVFSSLSMMVLGWIETGERAADLRLYAYRWLPYRKVSGLKFVPDLL